MDDSRDFDLDRMMEQLRLKVHDKRQRAELNSAPGNAHAEGDNQQLRQDLIELDRAYDLTSVSLNPNRRVMGRAMLAAAKAVSALLRPIIRRQSEYNAANTRLTSHLKSDVDSIGTQLAELRALSERTLGNADDLRAQYRALANRLTRLCAGDIAMHTEGLRDLSSRIAALGQLQAAWADQARRLEALERQQSEIQQQMRQQQERSAEHLESLRTRYLELAAAQSAAEERASSHYQEFTLTRDRVLRAERRLRQFLAVGAANGAAAAHQSARLPPDPDTQIDYASFEDRLRKSEEVKEKQRGYVAYFAGQAPVLDLGCGKGEFLELMREAGIEAKGLDADLDMIVRCEEKGLDVEQCDALDYLARQPDDCVGAIFSAQVIEHLTSAQLSALITLVWRKLRPGGVVVLETLNPESLFVHYKWFWMDPSHVRLVHPQTLQFLLESAGFGAVTSRFASPANVLSIPQLEGSGLAPIEEFNRATDYLNKLLYSDQEYALIAKK
jgi:2-polyprenyl-3-methyl-5-hydroxy-6-metoxy-1,4-benzoquinol methylase